MCARFEDVERTEKHTNVERGGSRDPGVRRPGAGRGQFPARSKIFRAILSSVLLNRYWGIVPLIPDVLFVPNEIEVIARLHVSQHPKET